MKAPFQSPPWDFPEFVVCPGRYFLAHFYFDLPKCPQLLQGGNVAALVWRFDDEPATWVVTICFRYYRDEKVFGSDDRKSWRHFQYPADEAMMLEKTAAVLDSFTGAAGLCFLGGPPKLHRMVVRGDWRKYIETVQREKPVWLHAPTGVL